ncbi:MAG: EamA family transporter [Desulfobacteraceae bacterium]|nr:MAG: EamA family transporter [Desulfobacteraceae bacterium]
MLGAVLAILAAVFWALAVILYKKSGDLFSPLSLNLYKSIVAFVLVGATMALLGVPLFPDEPLEHWALLTLSGLLGITLADMFFFMALSRLGAGLMAITECAYLPFMILFSFVLLSETLSLAGILGGVLVLSAIVIGTVFGEQGMGKAPGQPEKTENSKEIATGVVLGCVSIVFLALGIIMVKEVLEVTNLFWATLVRVTAGIVSLTLIILVHPRRKQYMDELKFSKAWLVALPASIAGNYLALICWMGGMKYTSASRAAILNQMSTIFIFVFAAMFLKEKITPAKTVAICLAVSGAWLTLLN